MKLIVPFLLTLICLGSSKSVIRGNHDGVSPHQPHLQSLINHRSGYQYQFKLLQEEYCREWTERETSFRKQAQEQQDEFRRHKEELNKTKHVLHMLLQKSPSETRPNEVTPENDSLDSKPIEECIEAMNHGLKNQSLDQLKKFQAILELEYKRRSEQNARVGVGNSSCLRKGTLILLATGDEKPVQEIKIGDVLLDNELNPTRVLGISSEFLLDQTFYGFDNESFFFTNSHILAGPANSEQEADLQFYVHDKPRLLRQNPLMQFIQVEQMPDDYFNIYQFDKVTQDVSPESVKVFKDPVRHPMDTMVYFIQVDNPSGTYFANGYVCRHEIPPLKHWPNTMVVLFSALTNHDSLNIKNIPYTLASLPLINDIVSDIESKVEETLNSLSVADLNLEDSKMELNNDNFDFVISTIFNHQSFSAFGMGLYGKVGPILSRYLDNCDDNTCILNEYLGSIQKLIREVILGQITKSIHSRITSSNEV